MMSFYVSPNVGASYGLVSDLDSPDVTPSRAAFTFAAVLVSGSFESDNAQSSEVQLDSSSQARFRFSNAGGSFSLNLMGWYDNNL